jgi:hypothetical protein
MGVVIDMTDEQVRVRALKRKIRRFYAWAKAEGLTREEIIDAYRKQILKYTRPREKLGRERSD